MMRSVEKPNITPPPLPVPLYLIEAKVVVSLGSHSFLLNDGRSATQALSCLICPEVGDQVLVATCNGDTPYILHILCRPNLQQAQLSVPGAEQLCIQQGKVTIAAKQSISLSALVDVEVSAATGVLSLNARSLFATVSENLVQNVGHFIGRAEHYLLEVKQLLGMHGQQVLVTAEHDVKVDAERISMG